MKFMAKLNLKATTREQQVLLEYLQNNASESLADKINNGVEIEKDGKTLINKKDLNGFMKFACNEAKKQAEKGANSAMVADHIVFGWAIHYFEESSILGTLFNIDGTEYKPVTKATTKTAEKTVTPPTIPQQKPVKPQISFFDLQSVEDNCPKDMPETTHIEQKEEPKQVVLPQPQPSPLYQHYLSLQNKYNDSVLMLRLGDFYEAFGNGAKQLADTLDLTLTGRDVGLPERVPMVGIPYHAVDAYLQKAINGGLKIALSEDINGDNATTYPIQSHTTIDEETGEILYDDIPTYEEMKQFDGDVYEPIPTVSQLTEGIEVDDDNDYMQALEQSKAFNPAALAILLDKFGDDITIL
jgi:hypothetical protein